MPQLGGWTIAALLAAFVAGFSIWRERRREKRRDVDRVGFMPWTTITVMAILTAVICAGIALKIH